ncbi:MAG: nitrate/TMAO reductase rane-bound tetraheme cytochrome subunit [Bacillales bacterium]|jgi:cytochrome c nitrite reductase small subunit|nr:nitrate/TMAO reductase rane-bound tetraheme cytochrome subunit [Bacillales bacterium]
MKEVFRQKKTYWFIGTFIAGCIFWAALTTGLHMLDSPEFCGMCHIMDDVVASHAASTHAELDCNDCHMPQGNTFSRIIFKTRVGSGHVYYNILDPEGIPNRLEAKPETKALIEVNCIRCHKATIKNIDHSAKKDCSSCHSGLPHGTQSYKTKEWNEEPKSGELLKKKEGIS